MSNSTFRRGLHKVGYQLRNTRRKGKVLKSDLKARVTFCKKIIARNLGIEFWENGIAMYVDGVGFEYKSNPYDHAKSLGAREWRKVKEGLDINCTSKGNKEGKTYVKFMVGMSHNTGVVMCEPLTERMSGGYYADLIKNTFGVAFINSGKSSRRMLQDGDPSQNSKKAQNEMDRANIKLFKIPARSPDLNPIENLFNQVRRSIKQDSLRQMMNRESKKKFTQRVKKLFEDYSVTRINNLVESMPKRIKMVLKARGQRIKY